MWPWSEVDILWNPGSIQRNEFYEGLLWLFIISRSSPKQLNFAELWNEFVAFQASKVYWSGCWNLKTFWKTLVQNGSCIHSLFYLTLLPALVTSKLLLTKGKWRNLSKGAPFRIGVQYIVRSVREEMPTGLLDVLEDVRAVRPRYHPMPQLGDLQTIDSFRHTP